MKNTTKSLNLSNSGRLQSRILTRGAAEPFKTSQTNKSLAARLRVTKKLRKPANRSKFTNRLARKLERCATDSACGSQACPTCHRVTVRAFKSAVAQFFANLGFVRTKRPPAERTPTKAHYYKDPDSSELAYLTIIPLSRIPIGELLGSEKPSKFIKRLERGLKANGFTMALLVLDISTHESEVDEFEPHYKVHVHGYVLMAEFERAEMALRTEFPNQGNVKTAVQHEVFDGSSTATRYLLKVPTERSIKLVKPSKNRNWKKPDRLRSAQEVEIRLWLDQIGLPGRVLVYGCGTEGIQAFLTGRIPTKP